MYISRIVIRNFRNFDVLDVSLLPGVTCIIGENNTGKTNLLHAIRLVLDVNLPSVYRQITENDIHCCAKLSTALQVLVSVELADYRKTPEECAFCGLWEVDNDRARITYRFRPRQSVREAIERNEKDRHALNPEDYQWELTGEKAEKTMTPLLSSGIRLVALRFDFRSYRRSRSTFYLPCATLKPICGTRAYRHWLAYSLRWISRKKKKTHWSQ